MFEKFTDKAKQSIVNAREECDKNKGDEITTLHLLLGILRLDNDASVQILTNLGVSIKELIYDLETQLPRSKREGPEFGDIPFTKNAALAMHRINDWCIKNQIKRIKPAHIIIGLLDIKTCSAAMILEKYGVSRERIISQVEEPKK